jgi:hypothetical protein
VEPLSGGHHIEFNEELGCRCCPLYTECLIGGCSGEYNILEPTRGLSVAVEFKETLPRGSVTLYANGRPFAKPSEVTAKTWLVADSLLHTILTDLFPFAVPLGLRA